LLKIKKLSLKKGAIKVKLAMRIRRKIIAIMSVVVVIILAMVLITNADINYSKGEETIVPIEKTISAGKRHTVAVKCDGTVVAAGDNEYGQCDVSDWEDIVQVSAGIDYTLGLKKDGTVLAVGNNSYGRCEVSDWKDVISIYAGRYPIGVTISGEIVTTSQYINDEYDVESIEDIIYVSMDDMGSVILINKKGEVVSLTNKELLVKKSQRFISNLDNPISAQSSFLLNAALFDTGDLIVKDVISTFSIGNKKYTNIVQYDINSDLVGMVDKFGNAKIVSCVTQNIFLDKFKEGWKGWEEIISISVGLNYAIGLKSDGTVAAVGDNTYGQCDVSEWTDIATEPLPMDINID